MKSTGYTKRARRTTTPRKSSPRLPSANRPPTTKSQTSSTLCGSSSPSIQVIPLPHAPRTTLTLHRYNQRDAKTRQRALHVFIPYPIRADHATPVPQQAQLHDLRWFPPQVHLRAGIHLHLRPLTRAPPLSGPRPVDVCKSRPSRVRIVHDRRSSVYRARTWRQHTSSDPRGHARAQRGAWGGAADRAI